MNIQEVYTTSPAELVAKARQMLEMAKAIGNNAVPVEGGGVREATDEERNETLKNLMDQARAYKKRATDLQSIEESLSELSVDDQPAAASNDPEDKAIHQGRQQAVEAGDFKSLGEYLQAVYKSSRSVDRDPRLVFVRYGDTGVDLRKDAKTLVESVGASGGFLVPTEFDTDLRALVGDASIIRGRATIIPMTRRSVQIPVLDQTNTTAGTAPWFGGMQFFWAAEAATKTQTEPTFRQIELVAHKMVGLTRVSDELLDDSAISLAAFFSGPLGFSGGVAWTEELSFFSGTGAGQPLGIINAGATITEGRNTANTVVFDDFADMIEDFLPSAGNGIWHISQSLKSEVIQMNGPTGNPSYIWSPNARDGVPDSLLGLPVHWTEKVPTRGSTGDVILADWSYYLIGDRQATTIESTNLESWASDLTSWRVVHRVDGQPWLSAPITLQDGTTQVSPFVILDTTAGGS